MSTKAAFLIFIILIFSLKLEFCESVSTNSNFVQKNSDNKSAGTQEMFLQNNEITASGFTGSSLTTINNNLLQDLNFNFTVPTDNATMTKTETEPERGTIVANGSITVIKEITAWDRIWVYLKHIIWIPVVVVLVSCSCIYIYTKHWIEKRDSRASVFRGERSREVSGHVIE